MNLLSIETTPNPDRMKLNLDERLDKGVAKHRYRTARGSERDKDSSGDLDLLFDHHDTACSVIMVSGVFIPLATASGSVPADPTWAQSFEQRN